MSFIAIEGIDGVGKSTLYSFIVSHLNENVVSKGDEVRMVREPGGTMYGEKIRELLLDKSNHDVDDYSELLLMYASRAQLIKEVIKPAKLSGQIVVSDRFNSSSIAYQGYGRMLDMDRVMSIDKAVVGDIKPDIVIVLDLDPEIAFSRSNKIGNQDRIELAGMEFFHRTRNGFLKIAKDNPETHFVVDAGQSIEDVQTEVKGILSNYFGK